MEDAFKVYEIHLRLWGKGGHLRTKQAEDGIWEATVSSRRVGRPATRAYGPTRLDAARWAWVEHERRRLGGRRAA
jgi:hypothetical protein